MKQIKMKFLYKLVKNQISGFWNLIEQNSYCRRFQLRPRSPAQNKSFIWSRSRDLETYLFDAFDSNTQTDLQISLRQHDTATHSNRQPDTHSSQ